MMVLDSQEFIRRNKYKIVLCCFSLYTTETRVVNGTKLRAFIWKVLGYLIFYNRIVTKVIKYVYL